MGAFAQHKFKKGFVLDEERLRKIDDILRKRLKDYDSSIKASYKVYRSDSFSYSTFEVIDVINEENSKLQKIVKLLVSVDSGDKLRVALDFEETGTKLNIEGEDRDLVYLLFSDLREYLSYEVNIYKDWASDLGLYSLLISLFFLITLIFWASVTRNSGNTTSQYEFEITEILESQDIHKKLNYLIESELTQKTRKKPSVTTTAGYIFLSLCLISVTLGYLLINKSPIHKAVKYISPYNEFIFGKEAGKFEERMAVRSKLYWNFGVALVVSSSAGFLVWWFTRSDN